MAKKYVETYSSSSSNAAAQYPEERVKLTYLRYFMNLQRVVKNCNIILQEVWKTKNTIIQKSGHTRDCPTYNAFFFPETLKNPETSHDITPTSSS